MSSDTPADAGGLRVWHLFVVLGLAAATAAVVLSRDTRLENLVMASLTAFAAIWVGTTFHRTLMPFGATEAVDDSPALSARARAALEREKMLALRTIKELEFDRAMGKVADADFNEMVGRLRARAIGIMTQLDLQAEGYRGLIERDVRGRLDEAGVVAVAAEAGPSAAGSQTRGAAGEHGLACASCGVSNDGDAHFCKQCGARLEALSEARP